MTPLQSRFRLIGLVCSLVLLAACTPPTPGVATDAATVPPTQPRSNTQASVATPTAAGPAGGYPAATVAATRPPPTNPPPGYPATEDPALAGTATPTVIVPPAATNTSAPVFITYRDFEIVPAQTTIKVGATVIFLIQAGEGVFHQPYNFIAPNVFEAPANMGNGVSYPYTFNEVGTTTILCGYHGNMQATVIVQP